MKTVRIAIVTPSITRGDAVSNDVLGMYDALSDVADVRIFAETSTLNAPQIESVRKLKGFLGDPRDILIYHWAGEWQPAQQLLKTQCRRVIKYHNITPPHFLSAYCSDFADHCDQGRRELGLIARSDCDLFLSDSQYNMGELLAAGSDQSRNLVVPPFHHVERLERAGNNMPNGTGLANEDVNVCTVGRIVPNKGHADLIAAFAIYHHDYNSRSKLVLIGKQEPRLIRYTVLLHGLIRRLKLEHVVTFADNVSDQGLKAYYDAVDVFAMTSQHEGFCVPLVEAMAMRVPIVAYASSAVTETIGSAGIVWETRDPQLFAESIHSIASDQSLRKWLIEAGTKRYEQHFSNRRIGEQLRHALGGLLQG
jgi:glycosyltransferase involved in cell wall biosynthesis